MIQLVLMWDPMFRTSNLNINPECFLGWEGTNDSLDGSHIDHRK